MTFETVRSIIADIFDEQEGTITLETNFSRDLGLDHMDMLDLAVAIEDAFDMKIPDEDVDQFETVANLVNYVEIH